MWVRTSCLDIKKKYSWQCLRLPERETLKVIKNTVEFCTRCTKGTNLHCCERELALSTRSRLLNLRNTKRNVEASTAKENVFIYVRRPRWAIWLGMEPRQCWRLRYPFPAVTPTYPTTRETRPCTLPHKPVIQKFNKWLHFADRIDTLRICETLRTAKEVASVALSAGRETRTENVFYMLLRMNFSNHPSQKFIKF